VPFSIRSFSEKPGIRAPAAANSGVHGLMGVRRCAEVELELLKTPRPEPQVQWVNSYIVQRALTLKRCIPSGPGQVKNCVQLNMEMRESSARISAGAGLRASSVGRAAPLRWDSGEP